ILVNGHNGNTGILNVAATTLRYEFDIRTAVMFYFQQASDVVKKHAKTERYGHACEIETSVMLELAPDCVRREALAVGEVLPSDRQFADNRSPFALQVPIPFAEQTGNGAFGDARLASQEVGREIVDVALDRAVAFAESFLLT
ncbi:MAG: creatininase family protein, partial [Trueperaceae bacterium]